MSSISLSLTGKINKPHRALKIKAEWAQKFVSVQPNGRRKTLELRSHNLRVIEKEDCFYLAETGWGKNTHGVALSRVTALLRFKGSHVLPDDISVQEREADHHVDHDAFLALKKHWGKQKPGCIAWEIELVEELQQPLFIPSNHED